MSFTPFHGIEWHDFMRRQIDRTLEEIKSLPPDSILNSSISELEKYYIEATNLDPIILSIEDKEIISTTGTKITSSDSIRRNIWPGESVKLQGTKITISIPFSGDSNLFQVQPSTYTLGGYPDIEIKGDSVYIDFSFIDDEANPERLKNEINSELKYLNDMVVSLKRKIDQFNIQIKNQISAALEKRYELCKSSVDTVTSLGIPIKRRDKPLTFTAPIKRKKPIIQRPTVEHQKYMPEPTLDESEYKHILSVIKSVSLVIERSPSSFANLNEEDIRTHILLQLNGHYEGSATGETFNASGKTDILIRVEDRNVFIGECKFWNGKKSFNDAVDQLLGYLSWRDSKCALIVFNKMSDSSSILDKMHNCIIEREEYVKEHKDSETEQRRYIFVKKSDPGKEIHITTLLFDMPIKNA